MNKIIIGMICFLLSITAFSQNENLVKIETEQLENPSAPKDKNGNILPGLLIPTVIKTPLKISIRTNTETPILSFDTIPHLYLKKYDNEITLVEYLDPETSSDSIYVKVVGKMSFLSDIFSGKMQPTLGVRPTKIDITSLKETQQQLQYRSYKITPNSKGSSYLILDWDNVVVINAKLINLKQKAPANKKPVSTKK
jgi:hypothetical protein